MSTFTVVHLLSLAALPALVAAATLGCSAGGGSEALSLGTDGTGGSGKGGAGSAAGGMINFGGSLAPNALAAHIESPPGVTVTVVTLSCANDCADVVAVTEGGFAPYTFQWEDGSTDPARHVCPSATSTFVVSATDSGSTSGEFARDPQTVQAGVTANVIQCPQDGGTPSGTGGTSAGGTGGTGTGAGGAGTGGSPGDAGALGPCDSVAGTFVAGSPGANPNGAWSYAWSKTLGGAAVALSTFYPFTPASMGAYYGEGYPDAAQWFDKANGFISASTYYSIPPIPQVQYNSTTTSSHPAAGNLAGNSWTLAPGQLALAPGTAGQFAIARWTAPSSGSYAVKASFLGLCGDNALPTTTADVHVQQDGSDVGSAFLNTSGGGNSFSFNRNIAVTAGDTIDFVVGSAGGVFLCPDVTALDASVCQVLTN